MTKPVDPISHWHHSVEGFNTSTLDFFKAIETTFTAKDAPVRPDRLEYYEGGITTTKREYLRISCGRYSVDISAFPFGQDFYFSWWLGRRAPSAALGCMVILGLPVLFLILLRSGGFALGSVFFFLILGCGIFTLTQQAASGQSDVAEAMTALPYIGPILEKVFRPITYYSEDSRIMFEETVHRVVLAHVGTLLSVATLPPLSSAEAKMERRRTLLGS